MRSELTQEEAGNLARGWWLVALVGLAGVVAGGILVAKPSDSLATLAVVVGIFVLLESSVEVVASSFGNDVENRALRQVVGLLGVVVGIVLIRHPTHSVAAIGLLVGLWLIAAGVVRAIRAVVVRGHVLWSVAIAVLEIAVGIAVVADPHIGYATLAVLAGIGLIVRGLGTIALALFIRAAQSELSAPPRAAGQTVG